jgi:hypothetical protein
MEAKNWWIITAIVFWVLTVIGILGIIVDITLFPGRIIQNGALYYVLMGIFVVINLVAIILYSLKIQTGFYLMIIVLILGVINSVISNLSLSLGIIGILLSIIVNGIILLGVIKSKQIFGIKKVFPFKIVKQ